MLQKITLAASLFGMAFGNMYQCGCTGDAAADITRIEYQIPMEYDILKGDVPGGVEMFVEYLDSVIEDGMFDGVFDIKKDHSKEWYRRDRTKEGESADRDNPDVPKSLGIKYRQNLDINGFVNEKNQNDLSIQMGLGKSCATIMPTDTYKHVYKCKNEANMFVDEADNMCKPGYDYMQGTDYTTDGGNGFTGRLEFDDDEQWDGQTVVPDGCFTNWPYECGASHIDDYFVEICRDWLSKVNKRNFKIVVDKDVVNFVRDIKFEVNRMIDGEKVEVSEGKLTFQVRFESVALAEAHDPTGRETEMSVKANMDETMEGQWDYTVDVLNQVVDAITKCGSPYVRYSAPCDPHTNPGSCPTASPSMRPTHSPGYVPMWVCQASTSRRRWQRNCPNYMSAEDCSSSRKRRKNCEWVQL